jgi:hypothetical protein
MYQCAHTQRASSRKAYMDKQRAYDSYAGEFAAVAMNTDEKRTSTLCTKGILCHPAWTYLVATPYACSTSRAGIQFKRTRLPFAQIHMGSRVTSSRSVFIVAHRFSAESALPATTMQLCDIYDASDIHLQQALQELLAQPVTADQQCAQIAVMTL